jgi:hypothetical protein
MAQRPFTVLDQVALGSHPAAHITAQLRHITAKDQAARVRFRCNPDRGKKKKLSPVRHVHV